MPSNGNLVCLTWWARGLNVVLFEAVTEQDNALPKHSKERLSYFKMLRKGQDNIYIYIIFENAGSFLCNTLCLDFTARKLFSYVCNVINEIALF